MENQHFSWEIHYTNGIKWQFLIATLNLPILNLQNFSLLRHLCRSERDIHPLRPRSVLAQPVTTNSVALMRIGEQTL